MWKILSVLVLGLFYTFWAVGAELETQLNDVRYKVTAIGHEGDKEQIKGAYDQLLKQLEALEASHPDHLEVKLWKAITLSVQAKYLGLSALSKVKEAKAILEQIVEKNPTIGEGAALNTLGILYYKVPGWPISFGDSRKAEDYFRRAMSTSSNMDTNFRYGEFLLDQDRGTEAIEYLNKAAAFPLRDGRPEDQLKKQEINDLLKKIRRS